MNVRNLFLGLLAAFALGAASADQAVRVSEAGIAFSVPDAWNAKAISSNEKPPKMDNSDPLLLRWQRAAIPNASGVAVLPGFNLAAFNVPAGFDVVPYSAALMGGRGWPLKAVLSRDKDGPKLPYSTGYLTEVSRGGISMKMFVIHAVHKGKFLEITLSATADVFPKVEPEFRAILLSMRPAE